MIFCQPQSEIRGCLKREKRIEAAPFVIQNQIRIAVEYAARMPCWMVAAFLQSPIM